MKDFQIDEYLKALEESESIDSCEKVPLPAISENQDYIFISYSHRDYKQVYADLAYLYKEGVRFWYDLGLTAGKVWSKEAFEKITNPNCSGVIFFMSENLYLSRAVKAEILATLGKNEDGETIGEKHNFFCVNIPGIAPSSILFSAAAKITDEEKAKMGYDSEWIKILMEAFNDAATYINYTALNHENALVAQIKNNFNVIDSIVTDTSLPGDYEGDIVDGKRTGKGICKYENGSVYEGEWKDNKYHGFGKITYAESDTREFYEGYWENGKSNGQGLFVMKSGRRYEGTFTYGSTTGKMTITNTDGSIYVGDVVKGDYHGFGKMTYGDTDNREYYEGEWDNDNRHGKGFLKFKNGETYEGEYRANQREGHGKITNTDGTVWEGEFKNGERYNGNGIITYKSGRIYEGELKEGKFNGQGKYTYAETEAWDYYEGGFLDDKLHGKGYLAFKNKSYYEGEFSGGNYNGFGKFVYAEKSDYISYEGEFLDNKHHGKGVLRYANGKVYEGDFLNDKRDGHGKLTYPETNSREYFEGEFRQDDWHGKGFLKYRDGSFFEGEYEKGKVNGHGKDTNADGTVWEGEYKDGEKWEGSGTIYYKNTGRAYYGEIKNGKFDGQGKYCYATSEAWDYYEGGWKENSFHGKGILKFRDGTYYEGEYKDHKRHGEGTQTYQNHERGFVKYEGQWKDDVQSGSGTVYLRNGCYCECDWINGVQHGKGVFYRKKGNTYTALDGTWINGTMQLPGFKLFFKLINSLNKNYDGEYLNGKYHGKGSYRDLNGSYEGDFVNGKFHGKGKYTWPAGDVYEGDFVKGKKQGHGVITYVASYVFESDWENDRPVGNGTLTFSDGKTFECVNGVPTEPEAAKIFFYYM